jgi:hypothetical protein
MKRLLPVRAYIIMIVTSRAYTACLFPWFKVEKVSCVALLTRIQTLEWPRRIKKDQIGNSHYFLYDHHKIRSEKWTKTASRISALGSWGLTNAAHTSYRDNGGSGLNIPVTIQQQSPNCTTTCVFLTAWWRIFLTSYRYKSSQEIPCYWDRKVRHRSNKSPPRDLDDG